MALTGLQIQKLLPKTNCRECGSSTCFAFAMKLASKKAKLSECPYASEEAQHILGAASEPPVRTVALGAKRDLLLGGETVLFRHEKTFVNKTALGINVNDTDDLATIDSVLRSAREYVFERVGEEFRLDVLAVTQEKASAADFLELVKRANDGFPGPLVLRSSDPNALAPGARLLCGTGSVLYSPDAARTDDVVRLARENGLVAVLAATDLPRVSSKAAEIRESGFSDLLLSFDSCCMAEQLQTNSIARRAAIKENVRGLGFPFLRFIDTGHWLSEVADAALEITKYGGVCCLPRFDAAQLSALMTLRLNVFTDPQKPIQVEPKLYAIGEPTEDSPVFVTTNFSLTFFVVSSELENSGVNAWLLVPECEGLSVLTAWAAGKFTAATIASGVKENRLEEKIRCRRIVVPGYVAQVSGELEENLPGWQVLVGPPEAADIEDFVKRVILVNNNATG